MRKQTLISMLVLMAGPFAVRAELILVDYEGNVTRGEPDRGYLVGDAVSGRLIVDTDLAPPDRDPDPCAGLHQNFPEGTSTVDFITGYTGGQPSNDGIGIYNDHPLFDGLDSWGINDRQGFGTSGWNSVNFFVTMQGLVTNDDLIQSFEVTQADNPQRWYGYFDWGMDQASQYVEFALTRLRVTPGRCLVGS